MEQSSIINQQHFTFELEATLKGHTAQVTPLLLFNDNILVSGSNDNIIKIWDLNTNECKGTLKGHHGPINDIIKVGDNTLVSCSHDSSIKFWDINSYTMIHTIDHAQGGQIYALCLIKNKKILLSCSVDTTIKAFNIDNYETLFILKSPFVNVALMCLTHIISPKGVYKDNNIIATGTFFGRGILWNLSSKQIITTLNCGFAAITSIKQFPTDRTKMLTASYKKYIRVWNIITYELLTEIQFSPNINWMICSCLIDDDTLICGSGANGLTIFKVGQASGYVSSIKDGSCFYSIIKDSKGGIIGGTSDNLIKIYKPSLQ